MLNFVFPGLVLIILVAVFVLFNRIVKKSKRS